MLQSRNQAKYFRNPPRHTEAQSDSPDGWTTLIVRAAFICPDGDVTQSENYSFKTGYFEESYRPSSAEVIFIDDSEDSIHGSQVFANSLT